MSNKVQNLLIAARWLISDKSRWTKGASAKDKEGNSDYPWSTDACKFCSFGAVGAFNADPSIVEAAKKSLNKFFDKEKYTYFISFNDHPKTKHEEVLEAFDRAIASFDIAKE